MIQINILSCRYLRLMMYQFLNISFKFFLSFDIVIMLIVFTVEIYLETFNIRKYQVIMPFTLYYMKPNLIKTSCDILFLKNSYKGKNGV